MATAAAAAGAAIAASNTRVDVGTKEEVFAKQNPRAGSVQFRRVNLVLFYSILIAVIFFAIGIWYLDRQRKKKNPVKTYIDLSNLDLKNMTIKDNKIQIVTEGDESFFSYVELFTTVITLTAVTDFFFAPFV